MDLSVGLGKLLKASPQAAKRAVGKAANQLLNDAKSEAPTVPKDVGTLRGSGSAGVTPQGDGYVGFNTPYAARLHEHPEFEFSEPGSGGKFLERPMNENREAYMKLIADEVQKNLG